VSSPFQGLNIDESGPASIQGQAARITACEPRCNLTHANCTKLDSSVDSDAKRLEVSLGL
jgi:hypothetical protein